MKAGVRIETELKIGRVMPPSEALGSAEAEMRTMSE